MCKNFFFSFVLFLSNWKLESSWLYLNIFFLHDFSSAICGWQRAVNGCRIGSLVMSLRLKRHHRSSSICDRRECSYMRIQPTSNILNCSSWHVYLKSLLVVRFFSYFYSYYIFLSLLFIFRLSFLFSWCTTSLSERPRFSNLLTDNFLAIPTIISHPWSCHSTFIAFYILQVHKKIKIIKKLVNLLMKDVLILNDSHLFFYFFNTHQENTKKKASKGQ